MWVILGGKLVNLSAIALAHPGEHGRYVIIWLTGGERNCLRCEMEQLIEALARYGRTVINCDPVPQHGVPPFTDSPRAA